MSAKLDRAQVYTRAFEGIGDHNVATGTIAAFRKENATRTKVKLWDGFDFRTFKNL